MALDHPTATSASGRPGPGHGNTGEVRFPADERLPCDRLLSDVWERARTGHGQGDAHTDACVYCRDAVDGLTALDRATDALRTRGRAPAPSWRESSPPYARSYDSGGCCPWTIRPESCASRRPPRRASSAAPPDGFRGCWPPAAGWPRAPRGRSTG
ncbi:hypothetical protein ACQPXT_21320 [Streptomyces sp. CA-100214]